MEQFSLKIGFEGGAAVVGVFGDVDAHTAPILGDVLGAVVAREHRDIVLDLTGLAFMDAAGLGVIASTSNSLQPLGGQLTLRSPPAQTRRILDITGVGALVRIEDTIMAASALVAEEQLGGRSATIDQQPSGHVLDRSLGRSWQEALVGSIPARDALIDSALHLVTALAKATVDGADGVSVSLERHGRLVTVASTNDTIKRMDAHQYQTGEGPCLAAAADGHWFHSESLAEERRWPAFVPRAIEEGIASILSTPLLAANRPLGALNIYSNTERAFGTSQQELASLFASQAAGILTAGADTTDGELSKRIADALSAREVIALAQGVLMARGGVPAEEAATMLHRSARAAGIGVREHAADIVFSTRHP